MELNEVNANAMGGTELMLSRLHERVDKDLLSKFQIICSRVRELDPNKVRILWLHDLPEDPESRHLADGGWSRFHKLVFVSNWQMQRYIQAYDIPWDRCVVMQNAIIPVEEHEKPKDVINLAYWSTPHRGLNILVPVFEKLAEKHDNIRLHVFSSFNLYGWPQADQPFEPLFEQCRAHPKIEYHGAIPNDELREHLKSMHILAYPSIWVETSCMVLMEAMAAGMICVHPNYGALYETAACHTAMYQWNPDLNAHAQTFYNILDNAIEGINKYPGLVSEVTAVAKGHARSYYTWDNRAVEWTRLLETLKDLPTEIEQPKRYFTYSS